MDRQEKLIVYLVLIFCLANLANYSMLLFAREFWYKGHMIVNQGWEEMYHGAAWHKAEMDPLYAEARRNSWGWILHIIFSVGIVGAVGCVIIKYG